MFGSRNSLGSTAKRAPTPPGTDGGSTNAEDGQDRKPGAFAEKLNCAVCNTALGKRKMNPRHHCRICGDSVCASCSPSSLQLEGEKSLQRACTPCVSNAQKASFHKDKLQRLGENLNAIAGGSGPADAPPESIDGALLRCEGFLTALEDLRDDNIATKTKLEGTTRNYETSKAALEETQGKLREETEAKESTAKDLEATRKQLSEMEAKVEITEEKFLREENLRQASDAVLAETRKTFEVKLAEEQQTRSNLDEQLKVFREKNDALEARARDTEARLAQEQEQRSDLDAKLKISSEKNDALEARARDAEARLVQEQEQRSDLDAKLKISSEKHDGLEARARDAEARIVEEQQARSDLDEKLKNSSQKHEESEARAREAEERIAQEQRTRLDVESDLKISKENHTASEARAREVEALLALEQQSRSESESRLKMSDEKHEASKARASEAEARIIEMQQALEASNAKWQSEADNRQKIADASELRAKEADARFAQKQQALEQAETKLALSRTRYESAEARVTEVEAELLLQKQEREMSNSRLEHEQKTRELADTALSDLRREHAAAEARAAQEKDQVLKELEGMSRDFHGMKEKAEALESQVEESRAGERVLQSRCDRLAVDLEDEKQSRLKLENMVQNAKSSSMDDKSSSADAVASCQAAVAVAESNAIREVRARKQAEEALDLAKSASIKLGERLWAVVSGTDDGSRHTVPTSLDEAVVFCQSALPQIEQGQRKIPELQQRLVAAEASIERQKLEREAAERLFRESSADAKAAFERQQRVEANVESEKHQREVSERQLRESMAEIRTVVDRHQRESAEWTERAAALEADLAREREQREVFERKLREVEHARERSPPSDFYKQDAGPLSPGAGAPTSQATQSTHYTDLQDPLVPPAPNQAAAGGGRCTDRCSVM
eukprot:TRINITY_DN2532_c0_g1_i1.p1 TRINITY_DN2532_c0_g1~~TRINITY_DN2532_c0_g1_i1.p1  ORF type:complete len:913 (+),score=231.72 TRINITY_DN2532_c0_g1_i1:119-2857(+)